MSGLKAHFVVFRKKFQSEEKDLCGTSKCYIVKQMLFYVYTFFFLLLLQNCIAFINDSVKPNCMPPFDPHPLSLLFHHHC